jgi:hypothetical protein
MRDTFAVEFRTMIAAARVMRALGYSLVQRPG